MGYARAITDFLPRSRWTCAVSSAGSLFLIYFFVTSGIDAFDGQTRLRHYGMLSGWRAYLCGVSRLVMALGVLAAAIAFACRALCTVPPLWLGRLYVIGVDVLFLGLIISAPIYLPS